MKALIWLVSWLMLVAIGSVMYFWARTEPNWYIGWIVTGFPGAYCLNQAWEHAHGKRAHRS